MPIIPVSRVVASTNFTNPFSGEATGTGSSATSPANFYLVRALTLFDGSLTRSTAPAVGTAVNMECINGTQETGTQTGTTVTLANPNTSARSAITGTWTVSATGATTDGHHIELNPTGAPSSVNGVVAVQIQDALNPAVDYHGFGARTFNLGGSASNRFMGFGCAGATSATTETNVQIPWTAGTFQYVSFVYSSTVVATTTLVLRKNGVDTAITFSLAGTAGVSTLVTDSVLTATVASSDLINWRYVQNVGGGTFTCTLVCGFIAS